MNQVGSDIVDGIASGIKPGTTMQDAIDQAEEESLETQEAKFKEAYYAAIEQQRLARITLHKALEGQIEESFGEGDAWDRAAACIVRLSKASDQYRTNYAVCAEENRQLKLGIRGQLGKTLLWITYEVRKRIARCLWP